MTDIKMSDVFDSPLDLRLTEMGQVYCRFNLISDEALEYIEDAINAYDANQGRIKELEAQQQWINVAYKKPTQNYCVDIWVNSQDITGRVCNCFYNPKNNKFWYWDNKCKTKIQIYASYVTHWMPLPKPPEG